MGFIGRDEELTELTLIDDEPGGKHEEVTQAEPEKVTQTTGIGTQLCDPNDGFGGQDGIMVELTSPEVPVRRSMTPWRR